MSKVRIWSNERIENISDEVGLMGVNIAWSKLKVTPNEKICVNGENRIVFDILMTAISRNSNIAITQIKNALEDMVSISVANDSPTPQWAKALFESCKDWKRAQGWVEKNMKKIIDATEGDALAISKDWKKFALTLDHAAAMDKLILHYETQEKKQSKKKVKIQSTPSSALSSVLFNWPFAIKINK